MASVAVFLLGSAGVVQAQTPAPTEDYCCIQPETVGGDLAYCKRETVASPCRPPGLVRDCFQYGASDQCLRYGNREIPAERRVPCASVQRCVEEINKSTDCGQIRNSRLCAGHPNCFYYGSSCYNRNDRGVCSKISDQDYCGSVGEGSVKGSLVCAWNNGLCLSRTEAELGSQYDRPGGFMPACAYAGTCRSVNDLLSLFIQRGQQIFGILGSVAFLFFVYGGLTMILSFGNPEKLKKGRDILVAAVVGIIIAFSAYLLVDFILDVLQVNSDFRGI